MANVKFFTGQKSNISEAVKEGKIGAGGVIFTNDTDELILVNDSKEEKVIKSKTQNDYTLVGTGIGALAEGATIPAGTSIDELLELLTKKRIAATYVAPKVSIATAGGNNTGAYEIGTEVTLNKKATYSKNDGGDATGYTFYINGVAVDASNVTNDTLSYNTTLTENTTVKVEVTYAEGPVKQDNFGDESPEGHIEAGKVTATDGVYYVYRKGFYNTGTGDLPEFTSEVVRAANAWGLANLTNSTKSITLSEGQQYVYFAVPSATVAKKIMYVETNDTGMLDSFDKTTVQVEGANGYTATEYTVYSYRLAVPAAATMTFQITF
jgi:hypothetical protein